MTGSDAWMHLQRALKRAWRSSRKRRDERRSAEARAHFWDEVRAGEREAESQARR